MKFKKLQIHNIASIEDAVIDFDQQPLSGSEVFLITGKTGSGKSTILDAVCLALYGNTPRLKNTEMDGKTADVEQDLFVTDVRQLMRRNTGMAWVKLSFEGSNGIDYKAEWSITRARGRVDGRLQNVSRTLTRLSDGICYTKKKEIELEIDAAVGLNFDQFCRTTMLAQGQFTQFLNSDDNDKAAILEKITGVDAYTRIGKKIYEVTRAKEQAYIVALSDTRGLKLLTDAELEALGKEEAQLTETHAGLGIQNEALTARQEWISRNVELDGQIQQSQEALDVARGRWESEDVEAKRRLTVLWNNTTEVRGYITEADRSARESDAAKNELERKKRDYALCTSEVQKAERQLEADKQDLAEISRMISDSRDKDRAIDQAQTVMAHLTAIAEARKTIDSHNTEIKKLVPNVEKLQEELNAAQKSLKDKDEAVTRKQEALSGAETRLDGINMPGLNAESESLAVRSSAIKIAFERVRVLMSAKQKVEEEKRAIAGLEEEINTLQSKLEAIKPEEEKAQSLVDERRRVLEQQVATVDEWAKKTRAGLKVGELCPVCRQPVMELPLETVIDSLYAQAEKDCNEAESALKSITDARKELQNGLTVNIQLRDAKVKSLADDSSLSKAQNDVDDILAELEIRPEEDAQTRLDTLKRKTDDAVKANRAALSEGEAASEMVKHLRKESDDARSEAEKAKKGCDSKRKEMDEENSRISTARELIEQKLRDISAAENALNSLLADSGKWENDWRKNACAFVSELKAVVSRRILLTEKTITLGDGITRCEGMLQRVSGTMLKITELCPDWKDLPLSDGSVDALEATVNQLYADVASQTARMNGAEQRKAELEQKVNEYLTQNSQQTMNLLTELNKHSRQEITELSEALNTLKSDFENAKTLVENNLRLKSEHETKKPQMIEEDSLESLAVQLEVNKQRQKELMLRLGAISQELAANDREKEQLKILLAKVESAQAEYLRWNRMNTLLGNATGDKFRRIAQSYVLTALIDAANVYMRTLSPRYRLLGQAGSFVISIEDAYQGYVRRAVSTVSGGESFLVSLSLALALSDIGSQLSVDTLFIDEGFGTLSGEPLMSAINTLRTLQSRVGRHVGIISHVDELRERIPVQIKLEQEGNSSSSRVSVVSQ